MAVVVHGPGAHAAPFDVGDTDVAPKWDRDVHGLGPVEEEWVSGVLIQVSLAPGNTEERQRTDDEPLSKIEHALVGSKNLSVPCATNQELFSLDGRQSIVQSYQVLLSIRDILVREDLLSDSFHTGSPGGLERFDRRRRAWLVPLGSTRLEVAHPINDPVDEEEGMLSQVINDYVPQDKDVSLIHVSLESYE